ncbi:MAG: chemotaxis protein CheW [Bosea sp. (in: a-proteobacteria)]
MTSLLSHPELTTASAKLATGAGPDLEYVTLHVGGQLFGLPINEVHEVFAANQITAVPLAPVAIKGLLNLRGRVVTAICLRTVLQMPEAAAQAERMAIGVDVGGEAFALLVDRIGDVMRLSGATHETNPIHLDGNWQDLSRGVHRLETSILVILDLGRIIGSQSLAA